MSWSSPHDLLVYCGRDRGYQGVDEPEDDEEGMADVKITDANLGAIEGFELDGEVILWDLQWRDPLPKRRFQVSRLRRSASAALYGELPAYTAAG